MLRVFIFLVFLGAHTIRAICRRRAQLVIENLALRQQVTALKKERPRPPLEDIDHEDRCHLGLNKDTPNARAITPRPSPTARVVTMSRVGGLHHRYEWRDAA